jgi:hypothetical protein
LIRFAVLVAGTALLLSGCGTDDRRVISKEELKSLKGDALALRVLGPAAAPYKQAQYVASVGDPPLLAFVSDPRPAESADLCLVDLLTVRLRPVAGGASTAYVVANVVSGQQYFLPDKPPRASSDVQVELASAFEARKRDCTTKGPAIVQSQLNPRLFRVWGTLAAGGKPEDAVWALRILGRARTAAETNSLPVGRCDKTSDLKELCANPRNAVAAPLEGSVISINRCASDPLRACVDVFRDRSKEGGATSTISIETSAKTTADLLEENPAILAVTERKVSVAH